MRQLAYGISLALAFATPAWAKEENGITVHDALMDHGDGHFMDMDGAMVMGMNKDVLPGGCDKVSEDKEITVRAGRKYAQPGFVFGFDKNSWQFKPCTRLTVHFINEDNIRHQWMMHGLPKYIYMKGMFHLEITGPAKVTGTLILPKEDRTYLVHCDIAQHMEKGMKGELKVGMGNGDLPSIPGLTPANLPDSYRADAPPPVPATVLAEAVDAQAAALKAKGGDSEGTDKKPAGGAAKKPAPAASSFSGMTILGIAIGLFAAPQLWQRIRARSRGDDLGSLVAAATSLVYDLVGMAADQVARLVSFIKGKCGK